VAAVSVLRRRSSIVESAWACSACGGPCSETDAAGVVMHHACIKWIKDTVAREMRPHRPSEYGGGGGRS
jgi:hypothetical protein